LPVTNPNANLQRAFYGLTTLVLVVASLYWARSVMLPLALAALFAFVLTPAVAWLERHHLGRLPAVLTVSLVVFALLVGLGYLLTSQAGQLARELQQDKYQANIQRKIDSLPQPVAEPLRALLPTPAGAAGKIEQEREKALGTAPSPRNGAGLEWLKDFLSPAAEGLAASVLVVVLAMFMLVKREDLRDRLIRLFGRGHLTATTRALDEAAQRISRYLFMLSLVNLSCGLVLSAGFYFLGVPFFLLWGLVIGTLRFIPYIGVWVGALFPILLSAATAPDWYHPLGVVGLILAVELFISNLVEPVLYGRTMGVSEVALLVAAAFWAWLWGPIGLVVAVPMTVCLAVLGKYVPPLEFLAVLLKDEPVLPAPVRYYQRLLAHDDDEAGDLVEEYLRDHAWDAVYDEVLLPALLMAQRDEDRGELEEDDKEAVYQTTRDVLDDLVFRQQQISTIAATPAGEAPPERPRTVLGFGCPAHDEADELALHMLAQLLEPGGCRLEVFSPKSLVAEIIQRAGEEHPAFVVLASLPPRGVALTRSLCKRLHARYPELKIFVVRPGRDDNPERTREGLLRAGASAVVTSLQEARAQLLPLVQVAAHAPAAHAQDQRVPAGAAR
jgi:predicted PurR-regulated permease PerM